jgi:lysozyme family protein
MDSNFDKCLAFVLKEEGGNDDDPNDHGGRTSRGIIQREWDKYLITHPGLPSDVWKAPDADIRTIYHDSYWMPHCPALPAGLDLVYFDFAVNAGPKQAIKTLQKALGCTVDGIWGPQTSTTVLAWEGRNILSVINEFCDERENFYKGLAQFSRYGKGWTSRNEACRKEALSMIGTHVSSPQANPLDKKPAIPPHGPSAGAATVVVGTVAASHYSSPLIFFGAIAAAIVIGFIVHYFVTRKV